MVGKDLCDEIYFHQNAEGNMMSPFECWLALRGLLRRLLDRACLHLLSLITTQSVGLFHI